MIETAVGRVVTGRQPIARKPAAIVRGIAVGEAIGKDEIDHLVLRQPLAIGRTIVRRGRARHGGGEQQRSEEHTSELQSLMRSSYAVFCLKKKNQEYN